MGKLITLFLSKSHLSFGEGKSTFQKVRHGEGFGGSAGGAPGPSCSFCRCRRRLPSRGLCSRWGQLITTAAPSITLPHVHACPANRVPAAPAQAWKGWGSGCAGPQAADSSLLQACAGFAVADAAPGEGWAQRLGAGQQPGAACAQEGMQGFVLGVQDACWGRALLQVLRVAICLPETVPP